MKVDYKREMVIYVFWSLKYTKVSKQEWQSHKLYKILNSGKFSSKETVQWEASVVSKFIQRVQ